MKEAVENIQFDDFWKICISGVVGGVAIYVKHLVSYFRNNNETKNEIEKLRFEMIQRNAEMDKKIAEIRFDMQSFKSDHLGIKSQLDLFEKKESERWHKQMPRFMSKIDTLLSKCEMTEKMK